jgi:hypothetical protein
VPKLTVAQEVEKGTLAAIEFEDADFSRPIAAIYRKEQSFVSGDEGISFCPQVRHRRARKK